MKGGDIVTERTKQTLGALVRAAVALAIFTVIVLNYRTLQTLDVRALADAQSTLTAAVAIVLGVYLVKSVLFVIPASLVYISVGLAFPTPLACTVNCVGILLEVTATYFLGRFLGGDTVNRLLQKNKAGRKILETEFTDRFSALFVIRVLPVFPVDFVSLFWGASRCRLVRYLAASLLGILPRVILFTILGDGIYDYIPIRTLMKLAVFAIPVGVVIYLIWFFVRRKRS